MSVNKIGTIGISMLRIILPVVLIVAGYYGWKYYKSSAPEVKRRPPQKNMLTIRTQTFEKKDYPGRVQGMGTVIPAGKIQLKTRVAGEIVFLSPRFTRGSVVEKGQVLCAIDEIDFRIEVDKAQSALDKALSDLAIEQGNQKIAQEEYKLIHQASNGEIKSTDLALRKPQMVQANAAVENARSDLRKTRLNLERTKIVAPFNCLVLEKNIDKGSLVSSQEVLATLVNVDRFHVEALIDPGQVQYLKAGLKDGSRAIVHSSYADKSWQGRLEKFTGEIAAESRMAGVLIAVADPLGLKMNAPGSQLMLNDYVRVELLGRTLTNVVSLPRKWLRDNDTVWIYKDGRLEIRPVNIAWKEDGLIFIDQGLSFDDEVIISEIPAPVNGMALAKPGGAEKKQMPLEQRMKNKPGMKISSTGQGQVHAEK